MKERELSVSINIDDNGNAVIAITDNESSDTASFSVKSYVDCNYADYLAKEIGFELLSWVDIARES